MSLANMKLSTKLTLGFGVLLAFVALVAGLGWSALSTTKGHMDVVVNENDVRIKLATQMRSNLNTTSLVLRNMILFKDAAQTVTLSERVMKARADYDTAAGKLDPMLVSEEGRKLFAQVQALRDTTRPEMTRVMELAKDGKYDEALEHLRHKVQPSQSKWQTEIQNLVERQEKLTAEAVLKVNQSYGQAVTTLIATVVGAMVIGIVLAWLTIRSITRPLGRAVTVANAVAKGDLNNTIEGAGDTETGQLLSAMSRMQSVIREYVAAQGEMKARHDEGTISFRIDDSRFAGSYAEMARMTNDLVAAHIAVKMRVVEVVNQYAKGDLSVDMDRLPGEKARITEVIDGVKASLLGINKEIQMLVEAAAQGDFTVRGDETKFEHEFRKMVVGLNQLVRTSDTGLREVSRVLSALAKGDLTDKMSGEYQGTFARVQQDCNQTVENLTTIVNQIKEASETIDTASKEITQGNTDLSQRTEEQASSLEETASSMEELTSTVKQNAENARQANQLAVGASDVAVKGGDVVKEVVTTMSGISESSKKIADIIGVIDGIAFQTNILALNAAVEAARAGEQGRGFAVVATEVRNLAQRSANAAKEIKELITDSVSRVDTGTQLVDEAGKTMDEIVNSVKRVTDIMAEITAASQEQSSGIEQVNQAITQMDEVTQQNAALVEEAAAAAESMQEQSGALVQTVGTFKLGHAAGAAGERRSPQRAVNVSRLPQKARATKSSSAKAERSPAAEKPATKKVAGSDEEWQEF